MTIGYFDCYKFLVIPLWLLCWNPYKIRVRLQKVISSTSIIIQVTFLFISVIISFFQHFDTAGDVILIIFFISNMITCIGKHCGLFFCTKSFESMVDYFNDHLTPESEEYQTILRNKTKSVLKFIYPYLGFNIIIYFLTVSVPAIQKYYFGIHHNVVPMLDVDVVTRSFTFGFMCLSSTVYNSLFMSFCNFTIAHIDVLIYQISHIEYERGFDKNELRKSLKRVMERHALILT